MSTPTDAIIRFLPPEERWKIADQYAAIGEETPNGEAAVLVLEHQNQIIGFMAFHNIIALGMTHVDPAWQSVGGAAVKLLGHAAEQLFKPGDSLFIPLADHESSALVEQMGCVRIGKLFRRDF